jgi:prepilin-type N-terminal cleavage/methylation domain-containing protein
LVNYIFIKWDSPHKLMVQRIMQKIRKKRMWSCNRQQGFTILEMMIVIGIIGIIATFIGPGFFSMRERYKLRSSATDVMSAMKRAQSEAVKRDTRVVLVATAETCTVFIDNVGGTANQCDVGETVILPVGATDTACAPLITVQPGNTLTPSAGFADTAFNRRGLPSNIGNITVTKPAGSNVQYRITLNVTGHTTLLVSTDNGSTFH